MSVEAGRAGVIAALCHVRPVAATAEDVLRLLARSARTEGCVADGFEQALLAREREHPTGLPTPTPVAIPHADPVHVLRPGLGAALLDPPVEFGEMGSDGGPVACRLVVLLLVTDPGDQVGLLSRVVTGLQRADLGERLDGVAGREDLVGVITALA